MSDGEKGGRGGFQTDLGFVLAAAGSAVGLGNIWKFPYITGEYGGGAFVLIYQKYFSPSSWPPFPQATFMARVSVGG